MNAIDIARKLASLGQTEDACAAYRLAIQEAQNPAGELEAALYIFQKGGDYKISYTCFLNLYRRGCFQEQILSILDQAFYTPNLNLLKGRYAKNCRLLAKYPYLFRKDFPSFEKLPVRFYPFDDVGFIPFYVDEKRFGDYINFKNPVVSRPFFQTLEKPILADDVYSQYELEYLVDNVRKSEFVGRENHIYLHYTDWAVFCAHLQCLNMRPLLEGRKPVFLIGGEIERYPIDFKKEFGIDYSTYPVKPVGIRELNRIIWHTQLATHNGGDLFNEVFDAHPNLLADSSLLFDSVENALQQIEDILRKCRTPREAVQQFGGWEPRVIAELYLLHDRTKKDLLAAKYLSDTILRGRKVDQPWLDEASRIVPAVFFQPHFHNVVYRISSDEKGRSVLDCDQYDRIQKSTLISGFKYIKTFTPLRRVTTSYGGTIRFMYRMSMDQQKRIEDDVISQRLLNRSFMVDSQDPLYKDSVLVRFEDAKLNPRAAFTALAKFLDIPYTESMTQCTQYGKPLRRRDGVSGFDPAPVYKRYEEYVNDSERYLLEYFLRDVYVFYGYDFEVYDGAEMDEARAEELVERCTTFARYMQDTGVEFIMRQIKDEETPENEAEFNILRQYAQEHTRFRVQTAKANQLQSVKALLRGLYFINRNGQPLRMMPRLELDPALLEQPLYH